MKRSFDLKFSRSIFVWFSLFAATEWVAASSNQMVLGVHPADLPKYQQNSEKFSCLSDPAVQIPWSAVNDDFCDCPDGSDEPGTSACRGTRFHCRNTGHQGKWIPSSRVRDGICDCCDGSDERQGHCSNNCNELAAIEAQRTAEENRIQSEGHVKFLEMVKRAQETRKQRQRDLDSAKRELESVRQRLSEAESKKSKAQEIYDAAKEFSDAHSGNTCTKKMEKTREYLQTLKNRLTELETQIHTFDRTFHSESTFLHDHDHDDDDDMDGVEKELPPTTPPPVKTPEEQKEIDRNRQDMWSQMKSTFELLNLNELRMLPILNEDKTADEPPKQSYVDKCVYPLWRNLKNAIGLWRFGSDTLHDVDLAKQNFEAASGELSTLQSEQMTAENKQRDLETVLKRAEEGRDGHSGVLGAVSDQCISRQFSEYVYELCWLGEMRQKNPDSQSLVALMGVWTSISDDMRLAKFENGAQCWNGPARSTTVHITCSPEIHIDSVHEPQKCEYVLHVRHPVACTQPPNTTANTRPNERDEL